MSRSFAHDFPSSNPTKKIDLNNFDEKAKSEFLEGAKIAYETIITEFSKMQISERCVNLLPKNSFGLNLRGKLISIVNLLLVQLKYDIIGFKIIKAHLILVNFNKKINLSLS